MKWWWIRRLNPIYHQIHPQQILRQIRLQIRHRTRRHLWIHLQIQALTPKKAMEKEFLIGTQTMENLQSLQWSSRRHYEQTFTRY